MPIGAFLFVDANLDWMGFLCSSCSAVVGKLLYARTSARTSICTTNIIDIIIFVIKVASGNIGSPRCRCWLSRPMWRRNSLHDGTVIDAISTGSNWLTTPVLR